MIVLGPKEETMTTHERLLRLFLRILGASSLLAMIFVAVPYEWMNQIHAWLGLGQLPSHPVVGSLARSTSAFYAMLGGLLWVLSFNPSRYRPVLLYLGLAIVTFGLILFLVDLAEGLPLLWRLWEGPADALFGVVILWLSLRLPAPPPAKPE